MRLLFFARFLALNVRLACFLCVVACFLCVFSCALCVMLRVCVFATAGVANVDCVDSCMWCMQYVLRHCVSCVQVRCDLFVAFQV